MKEISDIIKAVADATKEYGTIRTGWNLWTAIQGWFIRQWLREISESITHFANVIQDKKLEITNNITNNIQPRESEEANMIDDFYMAQMVEDWNAEYAKENWPWKWKNEWSPLFSKE